MVSHAAPPQSSRVTSGPAAETNPAFVRLSICADCSWQTPAGRSLGPTAE
jgi:hypothetical protein